MWKYSEVERDGKVMGKMCRVSTNQIEFCYKGRNVGLGSNKYIIEGTENGTFLVSGTRRTNIKTVKV